MGKLLSKLQNKGNDGAAKHDDTFQTNLIRHKKASIFEKTYQEGHLLGEGITGSVREVVHIPTGKKFAMKTINLGKIDKAQLKELKTEIDILRQLDHPNIVKLFEVFQDEKNNTLKLVMELLTGGDLSKRPLETEDEVRRVVYQIVSATRYFHARGVVHRDIKLENVLYSNESAESDVKVIDFGLGARFHSEQVMKERQRMEERRGLSLSVDDHDTTIPETQASPAKRRGVSEVKRRPSSPSFKRFSTTPTKKQIAKSRLFLTTCGTAFYMPPEMFKTKGYNAEKVDMWAIGVLTYILIARRPPFQGKNEKEIFDRAKRPPTYTSPRWAQMSPEAVRFVQNCLSINPDLRYSSERALASAWLRPMRHSLIQRRASATIDFDLAIINSMRRYAQYTTLKKAALMVMAHNYSNFQNGLLNNCFLEIDKNKQGYITYEEFSDFVKSRDATVTQDEIARAFRSIDLDRTGVVRYMEFLAASLEMEYPVTESMADVAFTHLMDDNGSITIRSMKKLLGDGFTKKEIEQLIREADLKGDRTVSRPEFYRLICDAKASRNPPASPRSADDTFFKNVIGQPPALGLPPPADTPASETSSSVEDVVGSQEDFFNAESDEDEIQLMPPPFAKPGSVSSVHSEQNGRQEDTLVPEEASSFSNDDSSSERLGELSSVDGEYRDDQNTPDSGFSTPVKVRSATFEETPISEYSVDAIVQDDPAGDNELFQDASSSSLGAVQVRSVVGDSGENLSKNL